MLIAEEAAVETLQRAVPGAQASLALHLRNPSVPDSERRNTNSLEQVEMQTSHLLRNSSQPTYAVPTMCQARQSLLGK